jgi:peptidoglycan/LPS O-acetylase OafA/YrhL
LRALAASMVFVQHLQDHFSPLVARMQVAAGLAGPWLTALLHHAHMGVDLFFVLSGVSLGLYGKREQREHGAIRLNPYAISRFFRLYPAYIVALLLAILSRKSLWGAQLARPLALSATLVAGYLPAGDNVINAAWSLTTEVLFYLAFPLLLSGGYKRNRLLLLALASLLLRALLHYVALARTPGLSFLLELTQRRCALTRLDQFVWGLLASEVLSSRPQLFHATLRRRWLALAAVFGIACCALLEDRVYTTVYGPWPYLVVGPLMALLVLAVAELRSPALEWIGTRSYGFFLCHEVCIGLTIAATCRFMHMDAVALAAHAGLAVLVTCVAFLSATALGAVSFATVEHQARKFGQNWLARTAAARKLAD